MIQRQVASRSHSLFTLHLTEISIAGDIEMADLNQDEEDSDPELKKIRQSTLK